jgi:hypothetical protein
VKSLRAVERAIGAIQQRVVEQADDDGNLPLLAVGRSLDEVVAVVVECVPREHWSMFGGVLRESARGLPRLFAVEVERATAVLFGEQAKSH